MHFFSLFSFAATLLDEEFMKMPLKCFFSGFYRLHLSHSQHKQSKLFGSRIAVCRWHSGESKMHGKLFSLVIIAWVEGRKRQNRREYEGITDTKCDNCFSTCEKTLNGSRPFSDRRQQARLNVLMITLNCLFSLSLLCVLEF